MRRKTPVPEPPVKEVNGDGKVNGSAIVGAKKGEEGSYRPAYELVDGSLERAGRASSVGTTTNAVAS